MDAQKVLVDSGLSDKESLVYLALVRNNNQTALVVAREAKLDRTVTYDTLEKLNAKGIVSVNVVNAAKHFTAVSPAVLSRRYKQQYSALADAMTELQKSALQAEGATCEYYSGKEGIRAMAREFIHTTKGYLVINLNKEFDDAFSYFTEQAVRELNRRKIKERAIIGKGNEPKKLEQGTYRISNHAFISPVTTVIERDVVQFFIWQEPFFGMRIKSIPLAKAQTEYFEMLWKQSKPS